mgnify:CR=1 FL=1
MYTREEKTFQVCSHVIMAVMAILCLLPFLLLIISSFTDNDAIVRNGYSLFPEKWSTAAYEYLFDRSNQILSAYGITVLVTLLGTCGNLILTTLLAYPLSRKDMPGRAAFTFIVFFTMLFNGGLVPTYLLYTRYLGIKNTLAGLLVPSLLMNVYFVLIMRTFFQNSIPSALIESAQIDGASEMRTFVSIVLPMGKPIIATVGLFAGIAYWNDWYNGMIYITTPSRVPMQTYLRSILIDMNVADMSADDYELYAMLANRTVKCSQIIVATIPILCVYPFLQRYFVSGIVLGSVKG